MANIPNPKVTMEFALGSVGWQESHYYVTNVAVDNTTLYAAMKELVAHRVLCLGGNVAVLLVKASQEQLNRDVSYLRRGDIPVAPESGGYPGTSPSYPTTGGSGVWAFQSPHVSWPLKLVDDNQNQLAITYLAGMPASKGQRGRGLSMSTQTKGCREHTSIPMAPTWSAAKSGVLLAEIGRTASSFLGNQLS